MIVCSPTFNSYLGFEYCKPLEMVLSRTNALVPRKKMEVVHAVLII